MVALWQQGEQAAFACIYRKYAVRLLAVAMQKLGSRELAQEVVQDSFMILFNNKQDAHRIASMSAYLYTIVKNKVLDIHKHNKVQKKYELFLAGTFNEADDSTLVWVETRELEAMLNKEVENLPPKTQNVFKLSRQKYHSNKEIASILEISENTVEQHMRKALGILRRKLASHRLLLFIIVLTLLQAN